MNSANAEGKLLGIAADSITVERGGTPQVNRREDVFRVRYADIRMRHTLTGMAIGFGGALPIGNLLYEAQKPVRARGNP